MRRLVVILATAGGVLILLTNTGFGKPLAAGLWGVGFLTFFVAAVIAVKYRRDGDKKGKFHNG